jgi:hypothetical protein
VLLVLLLSLSLDPGDSFFLVERAQFGAYLVLLVFSTPRAVWPGGAAAASGGGAHSAPRAPGSGLDLLSRCELCPACALV